jgi:hypothetical protein
MCRKLIFLVSFVFVLGLVNTGIVSGVDLDTDPALVGWWKFDEGAGTTTADSSGNGNDGTLNGPVEWVAEGHDGAALAFTGPYNYVLVPNAPSLNMTDAITIAAWINPSWTGNNRILQKSSGGGDNQYRLLKEWGDNMVFHLPGVSPDRLEFPGCPPAGEWTHLVALYDGSRMAVYYNGILAGEQDSSGVIGVSDGPLFIGTKHQTAPAGDEFNGMLDDVRIYNRALSESEIRRLGGNPQASNPAPADRAVHDDTWASLGWQAGAWAASHDVYFSDKMADVESRAPEAFQGNQTETFLVVGFPGFAIPDGLVPGTTYYWAVDEVNEANPSSPWKGELWRFTVRPSIAWKPFPPDKARLVDPDTDLSWSAGKGAKMHTVYFGDNFDDVNNATGGTQQMPVTYELDTLEIGKTYYWRVDEFDGLQTLKGDIWQFTTGDASLGGIKGEYWNNLTMAGTPVLSRAEPGIDYNWGGEAPGPGVNAPLYSVRWSGELNVPYSETYTFYANVYEAVRLWVNDQLLIENWMAHHMAIEYQGKIDLEVGTVPIVMEISNISGGGYGGGDNMQAQLSWSNPSLEKEIVPQTVLLLPVRAIRANPANGAVDVKQAPILRWSAGDNAASHEIYFGIDEDAVFNADKNSPEYKGPKDLGSESFDPGILDWDTTYYWRVDEVNNTSPDSPWKGPVWSFTTANFLVVDDFEGYDIGNNEIWWSWIDGLGYSSHPTLPTNPGNGTGAIVGDETTSSYCEETIVHGGRQAMPFSYDNSTLLYSETELTLSYPTDWTEGGVTTLTIWFRGVAENSAEPLYFALNGTAVVYNDDPAATQGATYVQWSIDLQKFADLGVDLTNVNTIAIGVGNKENPVAGGSGILYIDDIGLHPPAAP